MKIAIGFTNFGPYHLARLRALGRSLAARGGELIAYETAGKEERYPWDRSANDEPFRWVALYPERSLESLSRRDCAVAMRRALKRDKPAASAIVGYVRPESMAMLDWANRRRSPAILLSESTSIDHPRVWWKEAVKASRVRRFSSALVGGERHRDYLVGLGMPGFNIALGYNAVDNDAFAALANQAKRQPRSRRRSARSTFLFDSGPIRARKEPYSACACIRKLSAQLRRPKGLGPGDLGRRS